MTASEPSSSATQTEPQSASATTDPGEDSLEQRYRELEQTYDDTRARLEDLNDRAAGFIKENPGVCILGALAAGYVVGRFASRRWLV